MNSLGRGLDCADCKANKNRYWNDMCPNAEYIVSRTVGHYVFIDEHTAKEIAERYDRVVARL